MYTHTHTPERERKREREREGEKEREGERGREGGGIERTIQTTPPPYVVNQDPACAVCYGACSGP